MHSACSSNSNLLSFVHACHNLRSPSSFLPRRSGAHATDADSCALCRTRHRLISHALLYHICLCSIAIFEFPLPWDNHMYSLPTSLPYSPDSPADVWTTSHLPKTLFWNTVLFAVICSIHAILWAFQYIMTSRDESSEDAAGGISFPMHALRRNQSAYSTLSGAEPSAGEATRPELVCVSQVLPPLPLIAMPPDTA